VGRHRHALAAPLQVGGALIGRFPLLHISTWESVPGPPRPQVRTPGSPPRSNELERLSRSGRFMVDEGGRPAVDFLVHQDPVSIHLPIHRFIARVRHGRGEKGEDSAQRDRIHDHMFVNHDGGTSIPRDAGGWDKKGRPRSRPPPHVI
jgi:hypothetical protein